MQPVFLDLAGPAPALRFAVLHRAQTRLAKGHILYVHPLAEEMNKSRRLVAQQARQLAKMGWNVLIPDRLGCGDSPGDPGQASWHDWVNDVQRSAAWLKSLGPASEVWLWGLRAGALLALQAGAQIGCTRYILWQPQLSGAMVLQQFLRLRVASLALAGQPGATTAAVRQQIREAGVAEIAGYEVSEGMAAGLETADVKQPLPGARVLWMEVSSTAELQPASKRVLDAWTSAGTEVRVQVVTGPLFWQTTEIEDAPHLRAATDSLLGEWA